MPLVDSVSLNLIGYFKVGASNAMLHWTEFVELILQIRSHRNGLNVKRLRLWLHIALAVCHNDIDHYLLPTDTNLFESASCQFVYSSRLSSISMICVYFFFSLRARIGCCEAEFGPCNDIPRYHTLIWCINTAILLNYSRFFMAGCGYRLSRRQSYRGCHRSIV